MNRALPIGHRSTIPTARAAASVLAVALLTCAEPAAAAPHHRRMATPDTAGSRVDLAPLREMYLASVRDQRAIDGALREVERIRGLGGARPGDGLEATLSAYQGALVVLHAKHASWPPHKLRYLREGLAILDGTMERHPEHAEARYLRLMSCYYLPGFFGRGGSVRADFAALARLLPGVRGQYPADLYAAIIRFVAERGRLPAEQRGTLEALLEADA